MTIPDSSGLKRLVSRRHITLVGKNGAIEIRDFSHGIVFSKPGADGRKV